MRGPPLRSLTQSRLLRIGLVVALVVVLTLLAYWRISRRAPTAPQGGGHTRAAPPVRTELIVRCANAEADVYIDGAYRGKTPLLIPWNVATREPQTFGLSVRADGFEPHETAVTLYPGDRRTLPIELVPVGASVPRRPRPRRPTVDGDVVCIDPGHPSEINPGLTVQHGTTENHINWVVALRLRERLEDAGLNVVMTKSGEMEKVRNRRRAEIANEAGAAMMIRLHCDTGGLGRRGFALYYPDAPGRKGDDVGPSAEICRRSGEAARALHKALRAALVDTLRDNGVHPDTKTYIGGKQGALTGSIYSEVPVVTVEMVFLSDRSDAEFIKSGDGQARMASALADGVVAFVKGSA